MGTVRSNVQIGIEELALAISLMGKPEVAKGMLYTTFGSLPGEEEEGRLLAAGHSLMARGLLRIVEGKSVLADELKQLLAPAVEQDFIIHYDRKSSSAERVLAYFVRGGTILEERVEQGVVYHLTSVSRPQGIITAGCVFFEIPEEAPAFAAAEFPASVLDRVKEAGSESPDTLRALFQEVGVPDSLCQLLAEDFRHAVYRGSMMRVEGREGRPASEKGVLLLKGAQRIWLFPLFLKDGQPYARLVAGTRKSFTREVQRLLH